MECQGIEVGGIPLSYFLSQFSGLPPREQLDVAKVVVSDLNAQATLGGFQPSTSPTHRALPSRLTSGLCQRRPVRVGVLSWNVGGISDHRKEAGCGIHESSRGDVKTIIGTAAKEMGNVDVVVVGLQETISLTPQNAMKQVSSVGDSRRKSQFYSWPATVAQWVELLLDGLNNHPERDGTDSEILNVPTSDDPCNYALYGQPVYLFGMLLCVFCRTEVLKHIKDFGMVEKAMDGHFNSGAKGVVACRFVLFDRSFCFINCHLSAQKRNGQKYSLKSFEKRVAQIQRIWQEVKFKSQVDQMVYPVSANRAVFLLGDTNFRISQRWGGLMRTGANLHKDLEGTGFSELWCHDQLYQQLHKHHNSSFDVRSSHRSVASASSMIPGMDIPGISGLSNECSKALLLWREAVSVSSNGPPFPPTFKLEVPGPGYSQKRLPAWTDRVLYRSQHASPLIYQSVRQAEVLDPPRNISDHEPIFARFEVDCVTVHSRKLAQLIREVRRVGNSSPAKNGGRRSAETGLAFQASIAEAAQPEIEDLARRLFMGFEEIGGTDGALAGSGQFLDYQEECWHLVCSQLEGQLMSTVRRLTNENGGILDQSVMNSATQEVLESLRNNRRPQMSQAAVYSV